MSTEPILFSATGTIQTSLVETTGTYLIEAAGAEGGAGDRPGEPGARVGGMFSLKRNDRLKLVAGRRGVSGSPPRPVAGRGGDSLVWMGSTNLPQPVKLMLSARGGRGGSAAPEAAGLCLNGEADQATADALATQWTGGTGQPSARAAGATDRCGYNAGAFRTSHPQAQAGDGYVSIRPVVVTPPAAPPAGEIPSQTMLPQVTPRPGSWADLLRQRPAPKSK